MITGLLHTHTLSVVLFLLIYLIKCVLLWTNTARLDAFAQKIRVPEMIVSALFLITGLALAYNNASIGVGSWFWVKLGAVFAAIPVAVVGYRRHNKYLATLSLLLILYAYGVSETKSPRMNKRDFAEAGRQMALANHPELATVMTEPMDSSGKTNANYDLVAHGKSVFLAPMRSLPRRRWQKRPWRRQKPSRNPFGQKPNHGLVAQRQEYHALVSKCVKPAGNDGGCGLC